ncbi:MAG: UDP-N-acetylmuramoyl-L-alanine--D-glutamate ligase, partial [Anaerolineae bacterium]|nr:UDP-N-acetylmuramoyl-L-alanine--D-glutamate ligase [Anaerolineae bacterium]
ETRLFFALCPAPIIGITGSSGKTTTTSLVGEIMLAHGHRTYVGGNIGSPLLGIVEQIEPEDCVVMELSSFQLEALDQSPHVAAVLNVSPNHLDRHQTMDEYVAAKTNILKYQTDVDWAILNADQEATRSLAELCKGQVAFFGHSQPVEQGAYLQGDEIMVRWQDQRHPVCQVSEIQLLGPHNLDNVLAACAIAAAAGATAQTMGAAVTTFRGVEHRLELVGEINGASYFDDSIATSPDRTIAALGCFAQPVILLAGGREKHLPLEALARIIAERVKALVLFGEAAPVLEEAVRHASSDTPGRELPIYLSSDLREAVHRAARMAEHGDVVLLSPAFTSFDMYSDFAQRGEHFKSLVREMMLSLEHLAGDER